MLKNSSFFPHLINIDNTNSTDNTINMDVTMTHI